MIKNTTTHTQELWDGLALWLSIDIQPRYVPLFRRWAQHLGLSDADLAARIFEEGTVALVLEEMAWPSTFDPVIPASAAVDGLLHDLAQHLGVPTAPKEGPDAPDNG